MTRRQGQSTYETGRFTQEDPIRDGLNWYTYCGNNPVNYIDPWGLWDAADHLRITHEIALAEGFSEKHDSVQNFNTVPLHRFRKMQARH
jgi:uncharacterized protein RhaS with RHS repeats